MTSRPFRFELICVPLVVIIVVFVVVVAHITFDRSPLAFLLFPSLPLHTSVAPFPRRSVLNEIRSLSPLS